MLTAQKRFGAFYDNAFEANGLLQHCIKSVTRDRDIFVMFLSQVKKHHTLALFSFVRLHQVQGLLDLRWTLEAGASASYAIANTNLEDFVDVDTNGLLNPSQRLTKRRYEWLETDYKEVSDFVKDMKGDINKYAAHANIIYAGRNVQFPDQLKKPFFETQFFDADDSYVVKADLCRTVKAAIHIMDMFYGVNQKWRALTFAPDFGERLWKLSERHDGLTAEMKATDRFQRSIQPRKAD